MGSLLLLGSVSALAELGIAGYAEDLVRTAKYLMDSLDGKVQVRACPLILMNGTDDSAVLRGMAEVGAWLKGGLSGNLEGFPDTSQSASNTILKNLGKGGLQTNGPTRIRVPVSLQS